MANEPVVNTGFDPYFGQPAQKLIDQARAMGYNARLISGVRSFEDQRQLYANMLAGRAGQALPFLKRGPVRQAAVPGTSLHERGLAGDVAGVPQDVLARLASHLGLQTLANDPGHIQLANWRQAEASQGPPTPWLSNAPTRMAGPVSSDMVPNPGGGFVAPGGGPIQGALAKPEAGPESSNAGVDPRQLVFNKLVGLGVKPEVALGALWSLGGEGGSSLDPHAYNAKDPGGSIGYGQWNRGRRAALENLAKASGAIWSDPTVQADHIGQELSNKDYASYQPGVLDKLKAGKTSEDGARIWTGDYERPLKDNSDARIKNGPNVATLDAKGALVLGSGGAAATPVAMTPVAAGQASSGNWLGDAISKLASPPTDDQGNPIAGAKSPLQELTQNSIKRLTSEGLTDRDVSPTQGALGGSAPMAHNVSPLLMSVPSTYGQTLNSFMRPLTWTDRPLQGAGMTAGGLSAQAGFQPGISLNTPPALPQDAGMGFSDLGYGFV